MGRKKEPPWVAVRLTGTEKKKIEAAAEKCGLTVSEYMRQRALGYESLDVRFIGTPNLAALQKEELCVITCCDSSCSSKHPYDGWEIPAGFLSSSANAFQRLAFAFGICYNLPARRAKTVSLGNHRKKQGAMTGGRFSCHLFLPTI